ncbi:iron chaperone [Alteromonas ponticola]|uniref:DUF1801 domain-containing protein n=1 Tax=Alteromonas ponticola TaxID=2720613 RepID=A0ABX1R0K7_9ALTE|nr:DUF1801 domain-containing protein [Alteromonas ponticola]NMH60000.1 DUF1801 domain-containing protein [Alteromonas ponticola]
MSIENYLNRADPVRAQRLNAVIKKITALYPDVVASLEYKMPTFRTENGWVAVANQKNYISFYTCSAEHIADFKKQYPSVKTGKGCINFKDSDEMDVNALENAIHSALNHSPQHR